MAGYDDVLDALLARLAETTWPDAPAGFVHVKEPRPMRVILQGPVDGPRGHAPVIVKWSRPDTLADHVSKAVRGGKGVREGTVLRALRTAGVRVPEPLAFTDEGEDVLVTAFLADVTPLPSADRVAPGLLEDVAMLVAVAHAAGLRHDDLHAGNLALRDGLPVLVDLGSARIGKPIQEGERVAVLADLAHGLLGDARRTQRLRALIAYMRQVHGGNGRAAARTLSRRIEDELRLVRRRFRRGRDRRATRSGKHFEVFATETGVTGIRNTDETDRDWIARAEDWLRDPPPEATALKAAGRVLRSGDVVLKHYDGVTRGRLPRPLRAFRMAYALGVRGIPAPTPLLALAEEHGAGIVATRFVDAPNLHDFLAAGRYEALDVAARRRLLERLGRTIRRMHDAEVSHRDLKAPNLLITDALEPVIVDLDGARVRRGPVRWPRRARDLMRLDASLDLPERDRTRILAAYHAVLPFPPLDLGAFAEEVAALSRRKRGPSGEPR